MLSSFSNIRRTRFDQTSPVQPVPEIWKYQKISQIHFFFLFFLEEKKRRKKEKKNAILLVFQYLEEAIWPELSSPPRFRIQGG